MIIIILVLVLLVAGFIAFQPERKGGTVEEVLGRLMDRAEKENDSAAAQALSIAQANVPREVLRWKV